MSDFPSAYSISFDHAPSNSFNENQDSFTSFGSPQTPPRLRVMLRSLFDGTVPSSLNTGSSPSLSGPNLPSEAFSRYVPASMIADHLHNGRFCFLIVIHVIPSFHTNPHFSLKLVGPMLADSFNDRKSPSLESEPSSSVGDVYWYNAPSSTVSSDGPGFLTLQIDPRLFGSFNDYAQLSASSDRSPAPADIDQLDNASSLVAPNREPVLSAPFDHISSGNEAAVEMSSSVANDRLDGTSIASYGKLLPFFFFFF
ncbi:hypothetical protein MJO28_004355 [Puccinia striiformis f. sp. tritici]|uniref:Uncharacterized protein n=1 Tax=Puccinia striiformis f. sp. tritici TaxID=168172 RepID=A0ACC0EPX3_9BASI|nr:hypothetical protein MJO28_004355 [Puccinia striiformis f. sp. tritici]